MYEHDCFYWNPVPQRSRIRSEESANKVRPRGRKKKPMTKSTFQPHSIVQPGPISIITGLGYTAVKGLGTGVRTIGVSGPGWIMQKAGEMWNRFATGGG